MPPVKTIWYISQYAAPIRYGFGTRHFYLGREFVKKEMDVFIIASNYNKFFESYKKFPPNKDVYNFEKVDGIKTCWIRGNRYQKNEGLGRIWSWFLFTWRLFFIPLSRFKKPEVIILSSLSLPPVLIAWYYKKKYKAKLIVEIRDIWPRTLIDVGNYSPWHPFVILLGLIEKFAYNQADHIVATMPKADEHIRTRISKPFQFTCIPQGLDLELSNSGAVIEPEFAAAYLPANKFIIAYAGALGLSNALETIIDSARRLKDRYPDIHIVFLGDGPCKPDLVKRAEDLPNVSFAPKISREKVHSFLKKCDVVYDSVKSVPLYRYGLSRNKWMDYMFSGKPLLVSYSGYVNLINEADCGEVVEAENVEALTNAIIRMYEMDRHELKKMGLRGKRFVEKHRTFDVLAAEYMKLF